MKMLPFRWSEGEILVVNDPLEATLVLRLFDSSAIEENFRVTDIKIHNVNRFFFQKGFTKVFDLYKVRRLGPTICSLKHNSICSCVFNLQMLKKNNFSACSEINYTANNEGY